MKILSKSLYFLMLCVLFFALTATAIYAAQCWVNDDDQTACEAADECQWHEDPWGNWCEEKGCWNFWTQTECQNANTPDSDSYINKSCSWRTSDQQGWCNMVDCYAWDGTDQTTCESNSLGKECTWIDTYDEDNWQYPCIGPPEKNCWQQSTQNACQAITGCTWGVCMHESCWDYSATNKATCESHSGYNGRSCKWEVRDWGTECMEQGCWSYDNRTSCLANDCIWDGSCTEPWCGYYSGENSSYCINNPGNLSCSWNSNDNWCEEAGCWSYNTQNNCNAANNCFWETYSGGWCEELWCWNWDGDQTGCENASAHPGLSCFYDDQWCYENISAKSCSDITIERDCMDTFYCWWNYSASPGTCNEPGEQNTNQFEEWNPGCYIFDVDQAVCENTTGCFWEDQGSGYYCYTNVTIIPDMELNCSLFNNKTVCNSIPALSTCCKWQAGECVADKFDQSCRDQMQEPPEGAYYCEDYNSYTDHSLCNQIAGSPWYMPCEWNNATERCEFKEDDVFSSGEKNIMKIDNQKNCEAAGGKWIMDTYPSSNDPDSAVRLSLGRCDFKFDEERNCNKECYACEYKNDKTSWSSAAKAKEACINSELGICTFTVNSNAANGYGTCQPKQEFKKGIANKDCDSDCGACTYYGDPSAEQGKRPSDYCENSKAKCRWAADPLDPEDESKGMCVSKSEKICEDKCDKCYTEAACKNVGGKQGAENAETVCEWDGGICKFKSGADEMEICWDGIDNNGDNKMDCADSMCWSDPFCGGGFMFDDFGVDCFMYDDDQSGCTDAGCSWINETWGSWCDMPGATCWKKDGTNQTYCEDSGTCEWHSGFGGFCEQDWDTGASCFVYDNNQTLCESHSDDENCTWVVDTWCQDVGGWCESDPDYSGDWVDCWQYNSQSECTTSSACRWQQDQWCLEQGDNTGWCDHKSFACWQFNDQTSCGNATNSVWCLWRTDEYSQEGGWCEGKMMSTGGDEGCWNQYNQSGCEATSGCNWMSGFCDPPGFGGEMMPGMNTGEDGGGGGSGDMMGMGGFGMQCFIHDGDQTTCENTTGCGWFNEPQPFCDVYWTDCPQYSYNETMCNQQEKCAWRADVGDGFCDQKMTVCWNSTLQSDLAACDAHPHCYNNSGYCEPVCYDSSISNSAGCTSANATLCRWATGWCSPAMSTEFFKDMDMGGPPIPLGSDADDAGIPAEVDITNFGMKDMGETYGFSTTVESPQNSAACNDVKMSSGTGTGTNRTRFYWYLDTDGDTSGDCSLKHDSSADGYEFYLKNEWQYDTSSGSVTESPAAYRCVDGSWLLAEIKVSSQRQLMCSMIGGAMVAVEKAELEKFPSLYSSNTDIRVVVASADAVHNATTPSDSATAGWVTPGTQDFDLLDLYSYESDPTKKAAKEAAGTGFVQYSDVDCWTSAGCADYSCEGHPYCVENSLGVEAGGFTDTRIPKVVGVIKETYPDSAFFAYFTDKPANGTLLYYGTNAGCYETDLVNSVHDIGATNSNNKEHKLWHIGELYNDGGVESLNSALSADTTYYYRLKVCDNTGKCGSSKCSNFTTAASYQACPFCRFVSRIDAPTGWNVYYDLDTDGTYEHWQGHILGPEDGMFTNYTNGRRANIMVNTTDGQMEFLNVTLTKTGMGPKIRDINDDANALKQGTTTDTSGETVGYVGMIEDTRDKIIHNLYPRLCKITIPNAGTCNEIWHCDSDGSACVNRTSEATLVANTSTTCTWQIPYCEFSIWAGGEPTTPTTTSTSSSGGGGGSSSYQCSDNKDNDGDGLIDYPDDPGCESENDRDEADPLVCTQTWACTQWSECTEGKQTRTCYDEKECAEKVASGEMESMVELSKPLEIKDCAVEETAVEEVQETAPEAPAVTGAVTAGPQGKKDITKYALIGLGVLGGLAVVYVAYTMRPRKRIHR